MSCSRCQWPVFLLHAQMCDTRPVSRTFRCLFHAQTSVPRPHVCYTSTCLFHVQMSVPRPHVCYTSTCLLHVHMSVTRPDVCYTSRCLLHVQMVDTRPVSRTSKRSVACPAVGYVIPISQEKKMVTQLRTQEILHRNLDFVVLRQSLKTPPLLI